MRVYVMRHGVTDWNEKKLLQGNSNTSLNEAGREMARKSAEGMKDIKIDYIFSSPLNRAYETARIINEGRGLEIVKDDRLMEVGFGDDEGVAPEERSPGLINFFKDPPAYVPVKGAESFESLLSRAADFVDNVLVPLSVREPDATVFVSGHGAMNRALMYKFLNRELKDFWEGSWSANCSTSVYEIEGNKFILLEDGKIFFEN